MSSLPRFSTRYPEAISLLTRLLQSTHTNALLTSTQKVLKHTMPLGSYLLKPVQRILKYHLLLDVSMRRRGGRASAFMEVSRHLRTNKIARFGMIILFVVFRIFESTATVRW